MATNKMKSKQDNKLSAKERAKQIEKGMNDSDASPIIKWVYNNRSILTIVIIACIIVGISVAVLFGIKKSIDDGVAKQYINVYKILKEFDNEKISNMEESELSKLKQELVKVVEEGNNFPFKSYEYALANYYMGMIEYGQSNFESSTGSIQYFTEASNNKSYPFSDLAYFNIGKSYEQLGYSQESDSDDSPKEYYNKALDIYISMESEFSDSALLLRAKYQAGIIYEELKMYDKAKEMYDKIKESPEYIIAKDSGDLGITNEENNSKKETKTFVNNIENALIRLEIARIKDNNEK